MNKLAPTPRPNSKNIAGHPHYFGAFLNIAYHNVSMVIRHLFSKYQVKDEDNSKEDLLSKSRKLLKLLKLDANKPDVTHAVLRDLRWYFPFLNYQYFLNEEIRQKEQEKPAVDRIVHHYPELDPEQIRALLEGLITLVNKLRNTYSHYFATPDYSQMETLSIDQIYRAAVFRLIDKGKNTKRFDVFEKEHVQHLLGENGALSDYMPRDLADFPDHENTVAFITCLFLERKYAFPFLSRLEGFQYTGNGEPSMALKATLEGYTMFCCRLPQPKLESSDILLDMLNELGRCPSALYTVLSEEDRKRFHVKIDNGLELDDPGDAEPGQALPDEFEDESTEIEQEVVLKRHDDRFPYFALRYFDDTEAFPTLRFQVQLGRWNNRPVYEKKMFGEKRERVITKPIRAFARLKPLLRLYEEVNQEDKEKGKRVNPEFAQKFHVSWLKTGSEGEIFLRDEIEQFSPHYNFGENVIGLKFANISKSIFPKLPDLKNERPDALISTHELRNLFLYHYLHKTPINKGSSETYIKADAETFIKDYIERIRRFFADVKSGELKPIAAPPDYRKNQPLPFVRGDKDETEKRRADHRAMEEEIQKRRQQLNELLQQRYGLYAGNIPDEIEEYLLAYKVPPYKKRAVEKFKKQQKLVQGLIKDAEKGRSPRVGDQATWLAEDIIFLTPSTIHIANGKPHKQKLNNDQFRILQSSLAYFSVNKGKIMQFLKEETPILSKKPEEGHPFLFRIEIERCKGIFDFYLAYLIEKEKWLGRKVLNKFDLRKMTDVDMEKKYGHFLPSSVRQKKATERSYENLPVFLPRGLFNKAIAEALAGKPGLQVLPEDNSVHCLAQLLDGDLQEFYELPHVYKSIFAPKDAEDRLAPETEYASELKAELQELKQKKANSRGLSEEDKLELKNQLKDVTRAKTRLLDREQHIRHLQTNDRALWLMVKSRQELASEHMEIQFEKLKLRNIESVLGEPVSVKLQIPDSAIAITDELPLRRYGDLRRIAKDRRLKNLALYYQAAGFSKIPHERVKKEFEKYDRRREGFFKEVYEFEEFVYNTFRGEFSPDILSSKGYYNHRAYVDVAVKHSKDVPFNRFFKEQVAELRNKFHHNEFPWFEWFRPDVEAAKEELYADRVFGLAERYYARMRSLITH